MNATQEKPLYKVTVTHGRFVRAVARYRARSEAEAIERAKVEYTRPVYRFRAERIG